MNSVRRSQLIAPFGVGSIVSLRQGRTVIIAGLDHWFNEHQNAQSTLDEFLVEEPRLTRHLGIRQLRLPPDYRTPGQFASGAPNVGMHVPALRFPCWHVCKRCRRLHRFSPEGVARLSCATEGCRGSQVQVRFVAMCPRGHLEDFPWREWVHGSIAPTCTRPMKLESRGGASLEALWITCECDKKRSLSGIAAMSKNEDSSKLTDTLAKADRYSCRGQRPWVNDFEGSGCGAYVVGTLLNATNVYFAEVRSSIFLPAGVTSGKSQRILELIEENVLLKDDIALLRSISDEFQQIAVRLRGRHAQLLGGYPPEEIALALELMGSDEGMGLTESLEDAPEELKRGEYPVLCGESTREDLRIRIGALDAYEELGGVQFSSFFGRVRLVDKLRETRAFTGFTRIGGSTESSSIPRPPYPMLWRTPPSIPDAWLPAYVVHGEGIFIELNDAAIRAWQQRTGTYIDHRLSALAQQWQRFGPRSSRDAAAGIISSRFILLHTFAHLLINRLVFESGYSTASIRERIYSSEADRSMSAVLLYTASGDAEGTMGGLVALGEPGALEGMVMRALEAASWCSADPVCMEAGQRGGQGPDSCNLAACHSCGLLPETSCEAMNRFLDRAVLIGTPEQPDVGFFSSVVQ